ncbi:EAL domain-containing protein [Alteromonas aestuariivivens]|uniref:EAL domain-containing protein n=1 Tax=Alteromonas aestuariivivens TaxID=1938339 RepID=A0A3D8M3D8_9ALTE|nr:EAL domain-containing protein [Alteromonas aestuariivivens]RDV24209.1 EAL domain-containing protein [Alteromonas aestuariivivens]
MPIQEVTDKVELDNIVPYFQPIIDLHQSRVWRYECLARLVAGKNQTFLPNDFLYLIERHNHVQRLAETMFIQSANYFHNKSVAWNINLNAADIVNEPLINFIFDQLKHYPNPSRVSAEISATTAMQHFDDVQAFVERGLQHGLGVFIDSVGSSPVNTKKLLTLPIRGLKLAGGLIREYKHQAVVREFVDHLCKRAQARSLSLIAEHIEDQTLLDTVHKLPIRYAQGYVFSQPLPQAFSNPYR